jgi:hypothetical protein
VIRKTDVDGQPFFKLDWLWLLLIHELFNFGKGVPGIRKARPFLSISEG